MSRTETYRQFFTKYPPENAREEMINTILLSLAQKTERLEKQNAEVIRALNILSQKVETPASESSPPPPGPGESRDQTPFPEGVTPNVGSSPAMNAAPIPQKAKGKNGAKDTQP